LRRGNITAQVAPKSRNFQGLIDTLRVPTLHSDTDDLEEDTIVRKLISLAAAAALLASTTASIAADTQSASSQPLAPGAAAGIHNAQTEWTPAAWWWVGAGLVGLGVGTAIVISNNNGHGGNHAATNTTP
jgi:hypothetical protein